MMVGVAVVADCLMTSARLLPKYQPPSNGLSQASARSFMKCSLCGGKASTYIMPSHLPQLRQQKQLQGYAKKLKNSSHQRMMTLYRRQSTTRGWVIEPYSGASRPSSAAA